MWLLQNARKNRTNMQTSPIYEWYRLNHFLLCVDGQGVVLSICLCFVPGRKLECHSLINLQCGNKRSFHGGCMLGGLSLKPACPQVFELGPLMCLKAANKTALAKVCWTQPFQLDICNVNVISCLIQLHSVASTDAFPKIEKTTKGWTLMTGKSICLSSSFSFPLHFLSVCLFPFLSHSSHC